MIPYFPQPHWMVGSFQIHAFGLTAGAALLLGYALVLRWARAYGLDAAEAGRMALVSVLGSLLGGIAWTGAHSVSLSGAVVSGVVTLLLLARGPRLWRILDLFGCAFCCALVVARFGCFLAHDHLGPASANWLAVQFPGGSRLDLGLLYFLAAGVTVIVLYVASHWPLPPGCQFGLACAVAGSSRLLILGLAQPSPSDWAVASLSTVSGCVLMVRSAATAHAPQTPVSYPQSS